MRKTILALAAYCLATPAMAGDISVEVRDQTGRAVPNAVAMVKPAGGVPAGKPMKVSWPMVMAQQNIQFSPYVLIVPLGSSVSFPNKDKVRHHVYSFSAPKKFELKLYGKDETRSVVFDKPGAVSLGCNIHDTMIAFIYVTETPYAMKSGVDGVATVQDVPAGAGQLMVWHPDLKAKVPVTKALSVAGAAQRVSVVLDLRPSTPR